MSLSEMDRNMRRIKEAGEQLTGEKLPRLKAKARKQKKTRYPQNRRWFHAEKR